MNDQKELTGSEPVIGSLDAPVIFADGYHGVVSQNGVLKLRLTQTKMADSGDAELQVVAHLTMSTATLVGFYNALVEVLNDLREKGAIPSSIKLEAVKEPAEQSSE